MPFVHDQKVVDQAKQLWTNEGYSPEEIVDELIRETRERGVLEGCRVPTKATGRQLMQHWAKVHGWDPHWKEARSRLTSIEKDYFVVTEIKDPIWHLVQIRAKQWMRDHIITERTLEDLLTEIESEYDPGFNALRMIREQFASHVRTGGKRVSNANAREA